MKIKSTGLRARELEKTRASWWCLLASSRLSGENIGCNLLTLCGCINWYSGDCTHVGYVVTAGQTPRLFKSVCRWSCVAAAARRTVMLCWLCAHAFVYNNNAMSTQSINYKSMSQTPMQLCTKFVGVHHWNSSCEVYARSGWKCIGIIVCILRVWWYPDRVYCLHGCTAGMQYTFDQMFQHRVKIRSWPL
jgi:hypothetical protein